MFNKDSFYSAIRKSQQILGLKVLILRLHYMTIYFAVVKFPNKELVTTKGFASSRFKKQIPKSLSWLLGNLDTEYNKKKKQKNLISKTWYLKFYYVLQLSNLVRLVGITKKDHLNDLIMTV